MTTNVRLPHANCPACELSRYRNNGPAAYEGPDDPQVIFVGTGLGEHEARFRRPFIGPSGQLLRGTADLFGAGRYGLTNVVACRPPNNGDPSPQMIHACSGRLRAELERFPGVPLVALGKIAVRALLPGLIKARAGDKEGGMKLIDGCWYESPDGRLVLVSYHPENILRESVRYPTFSLTMENAFRPPVLLHKPKVAYRVIEDVSELWEARNRHPRIVSLDIETTGLKIRDKITCNQLAWQTDMAYIVPRDLVVTGGYKDFLEQIFQDSLIVGHNLKFDLSRLMYHLGVSYARQIFDTMLAYYSINEQGLIVNIEEKSKDSQTSAGFKLKVLLKRIFGVEYGHSNDWDVDWSNPDAVTAHYEYSALDACYTLKLAGWVKRRMEDRSLRLSQEHLFPLNKRLLQMEMGGMRFDEGRGKENQTLFKAQTAEYTKQIIASIETDCYRYQKDVPANLAKFNPNSPPQVQKLLYETWKMPPQTKRDKKTGEIKLTADAAALKRLLDLYPDCDTIRYLLGYRPVTKLNGTFVEGPMKRLDENGYVHTSLYPLTETGRLSAKDPNLQNIKRAEEDDPNTQLIKLQYLPDTGHVLVQFDYSQAELRVLAWISGEDSMIQAFRDGVDLHRQTAIDMYGEKFLTATPGMQKKMRSEVKPVNFGVPYGVTPQTMANSEMDKLTQQERAETTYEKLLAKCIQVYNDWFAVRPKIKVWMQKVVEEAYAIGYIETPFGRRRHVGFLPPFPNSREANHLRNELMNFPIQSIASDLTETSIIRIGNELDKGEIEARMVLTVHDSILFSCPPCEVEILVEMVKPIMIEVPREYLGELVPFDVDVEVGPSWGEVVSYEKWLKQQMEVAA